MDSEHSKMVEALFTAIIAITGEPGNDEELDVITDACNDIAAVMCK